MVRILLGGVMKKLLKILFLFVLVTPYAIGWSPVRNWRFRRILRAVEMRRPDVTITKIKRKVFRFISRYDSFTPEQRNAVIDAIVIRLSFNDGYAKKFALISSGRELFANPRFISLLFGNPINNEQTQERTFTDLAEFLSPRDPEQAKNLFRVIMKSLSSVSETYAKLMGAEKLVRLLYNRRDERGAYHKIEREHCQRNKQ